MLKNYFEESKYEHIKNMEDLVMKATVIVTDLFKNDIDKGGNSYLLHLLYVYSGVKSKEEKTIAMLHDILEEKEVSSEDLIEVGFSKNIVNDVLILTKDKSISYEEYIDNIIKNGSIESIRVKLADLDNNMDLSRIKNPTEVDYDRINNKYIPAYEKLKKRLEEMEK